MGAPLSQRPDESAEYWGSTARWEGPVVSTKDTVRVDAGEDASKLKKEFAVRPELIGGVAELNADNYVIRFRQATPSSD